MVKGRYINEVGCRDALIRRKLKQIRFVLVLVLKKQISLICFSFETKKANRFDLF